MQTINAQCSQQFGFSRLLQYSNGSVYFGSLPTSGSPTRTPTSATTEPSFRPSASSTVGTKSSVTVPVVVGVVVLLLAVLAVIFFIQWRKV